MENLGLDERALTKEQRRLLGGWQDILDDVRHLHESLQALPDGCGCGHGASHLSGSCSCCQTAHPDRVPDCPDCDNLLAQLRPAIDVLTVDTWRFFPVIKMLLESPRLGSAHAQATDIERHIAGAIATFNQLVVAADEFRTGCRASHLHVLKERAADLLMEVTRLDRRL